MAVVGLSLLVMVISSNVAAQGALVMVQRNTFAPTANPVMPELAALGEVIVPPPEINVHKPLPTVGIFPARVAVVVAQINWSAPAAATVGFALIEITTLSELAIQGALDMVQRKVAVTGMLKPVMPELGELAEVIVAVPETKDQEPVPTDAMFPDNVAVLMLQAVISAPALAVVGLSLLVMVISSNVAAQGALVMVQRNTFAPTPNPVIPELAALGEVIVPVPETSVHDPVPAVGVFPARVAVVAQINWSVPAAAVRFALISIITSSVEATQGELDIVQRKVAVPGMLKPVMPEVGELAEVIVAVPETKDQKPVPTDAMFPDNVAVLLLQANISAPALAAVGVALKLIAMVWAVPLPQILLGVTVSVPEVAALEKLAVMELLEPPVACV